MLPKVTINREAESDTVFPYRASRQYSEIELSLFMYVFFFLSFFLNHRLI